MDHKATFCIFVTTLLLCHITQATRANRNLAEAVVKFVKEGTYHFQQEPPDAANLLPQYDFIIVGAGSSGCVLANRLSQVPDWNILLIEAGDHENYIMDIPLLTPLFQLTEANWQYKTEPSRHVCLGMKNKQCSYPRGKVVGGSSSINFMIYIRGNRRDYDHWEKLGNPGWGYDDVLPYFLEIENMTIPELIKNSRYHSTQGEMTISYAPYRTRLAEAFVEAGMEMGYKVVDYNGETQTGFSFLQTNTRNGTRWSASRAFLHPEKLSLKEEKSSDQDPDRPQHKNSVRCGVCSEQEKVCGVCQKGSDSVSRGCQLSTASDAVWYRTKAASY
jgi:choline dehydrogenase-like flavoprotein